MLSFSRPIACSFSLRVMGQKAWPVRRAFDFQTRVCRWAFYTHQEPLHRPSRGPNLAPVVVAARASHRGFGHGML